MIRNASESGSLVAFAIVVALAGLTAACTEDPLALGSDTAPGATSVTRDVTLPVAALANWRDTTVTGFALPADAPFTLASNDDVLSARTLVVFNVPDTINTFADTLPVDTFDSVSVRLQIDTIRSSFSDFPVTFRLMALNRPFADDSVSWTETGAVGPWTTPGGDLGVQLGEAELTALSDTLLMQIDVDGDSLLKSWQDLDGGNGFAVLVEGPAARVRLQQVLLRYEALLVGRTVPVERSQTPRPRTFIVDPPTPAAGLGLRVGGLPSSRLYLEFLPPETAGGVPLAGATVNHAELILTPLAAPPAPFAIETPLASRQMSLLGDPFVLGTKTPIGTSNLTVTTLDPDSLAAGAPLRLDITLLLVRAAGSGSVGPIRIGLRADPDAQTLGYWEFGSIESIAALQPQLRLVLSPPPEFTVP